MYDCATEQLRAEELRAARTSRASSVPEIFTTSESIESCAPENFSNRIRVSPALPTRYATSLSPSAIVSDRVGGEERATLDPAWCARPTRWTRWRGAGSRVGSTRDTADELELEFDFASALVHVHSIVRGSHGVRIRPYGEVHGTRLLRYTEPPQRPAEGAQIVPLVPPRPLPAVRIESPHICSQRSGGRALTSQGGSHQGQEEVVCGQVFTPSSSR